VFARRVLAAAALASLGFACEDGLGECDLPAAQEVVYSRSNLVATKGQALVHDSCGQGAFCHSAAASGSARRGVPASLNFDMLPRATGLKRVLELREEVWSTVHDGTMPPRGFAVGDSDWSFEVARPDGETRLSALSTRAGKAALRNWLACGAPVVVETGVPEWAHPAGPVTSSWNDLHSSLMVPKCATSNCHDARGARAAGNLDLSNLCEARSALLKSGTCGEKRVVPGDASSLLIDKVTNTAPECGTRMPPAGGVTAQEIEALRSWVTQGATAADCP